MKEIGIYIHVPFCKQKCKYCDFISFSNCEDKFEKYINAIVNEINLKVVNIENTTVTTIYIGGGTPSLINEQYIEKIIKALQNKFVVSKNAEITIEVNPGTVIKEKLLKYFEIGINRLSIGLQSTDDRLLNLIGRIHDYKEFEETFELARSVGFKNINVDLMIGLPEQSIYDVEKSVNDIIKKNPEHISVYSLIVEEETQMYNMVSSGKFKLPDEDTEREMYWKVKTLLEENGYLQYEISNFSKQGYESKHNMNCWSQAEYIGYGLAAHSYFENKRFSNINNLNQYIENCMNGKLDENIIMHEEQNVMDKMKEYMLLGLRKIDGISFDEFKKKFKEDVISVFECELKKLINDDLIIIENNNIKLTDKGLNFANLVWMEFV